MLSRIIIHSAIMLALMSSSVFILLFSNELVNSDICSTTHLWWYVILPHYIINVLANS